MMQQPTKPEYTGQSHSQINDQYRDASVTASTLQHVRSTNYQDIAIRDNAQAQFGDRYQQNHGLVINANSFEIDGPILQQLARVDLNASSKRRTFGLCLGQAPQIEQDAFIGRRAELQQLQEWFSQVDKNQKVVSIVGMGGLGKTQLSLAYAKEHGRRYTSLFWVNAKDEVSLRQSFSNIASFVSPNDESAATNTSEEKAQVELVRRWLSEEWNNEWLMIYDNYDDPNLPNIRSATGFDIRSYFPHRAHGHILITTRSPKLTFSKRLKLQKFDDIDSSLAVLSQRADRDLTTDVNARRLATRLDGLPLALATAGTYLGQTNASCTEYLEAYESAWTDLYGPDTEALFEYEDRTLSSTWVVSFDQVCKLDPNVAELFKFWAYFSNKDIWYELIRGGADDGPAWMCRVTANKMTFDRAIMKLQDYSLVEIVSGSYNIHPCIHDWISEYFDFDRTGFVAAVKCVVHGVPNQDQGSKQYRSITHRLLSHINRLSNDRFEVFWQASLSDAKTLAYSNTLGTLLYDWDFMDQAETMYLRALTGCERGLAQDHPLSSHIRNNLGLLYQYHGALNKAEKMYERALAGYTTVLGPNSLDALRTMGNLGRLYHRQDRLERAEQMHQRVLAGREKTLGSDHIETLKTVNNLASTYLDQGKLVEAEEKLLQVLAKTEESLGRYHASTLQSVHQLGRLYQKQSKLNQAEEMYLRVLAGTELTVGPNHSSTLQTMNNLGSIFLQQGKPMEAKEMLLRVLTNRENIFGYAHLSTLKAVNKLGDLYRGQNKLEEAEKMYLRALAETNETLGSYHPSTLKTAKTLAILYLDQDKLDEAKRILSRTLSTFQSDFIISKVLNTSIRVKAANLQDSKHQLSHLIRLFDDSGDRDTVTILYTLGRALFWMKDEENYLIAYTPAGLAKCDGCNGKASLAEGHHICCQCDDRDLCSECMTKYRDQSLALPHCREHEYFDMGTAISTSANVPETMTSKEISAWVDRLKKKYPLVVENQEQIDS